MFHYAHVPIRIILMRLNIYYVVLSIIHFVQLTGDERITVVQCHNTYIVPFESDTAAATC